MSNYQQQKRWRAIYRGIEDRSHFVPLAVGSEGRAELSISYGGMREDNDLHAGWDFLADEPWEGFHGPENQLRGRLDKPRLWAEDDELDFPDDPEITLPRLEAMKSAIIHVANQITGSTFTRFCELVPHFSGPRIFSFPESRIHLWHGLTSLAIKALKELSKEGKLVAERASFALYSIDGGVNSVMRLPRLQKTVHSGEGFVQPFDCWLPLVFWTIEQIAKARGKRGASRIILTDGGGKESCQTNEKEPILGQMIWEGKLEAPLPRLVETIHQREENMKSEETLIIPQTKRE